MNSRERVLAAIHHQMPDRVPLDLGSTDVSGIHAHAYRRLCEHLGIAEEVQIQDPLQGLAYVSTQMRECLQIDTVGVWLNPTLEAVDAAHVRDEWGTVWRRPEHGLWYEPIGFPLESASPSEIAAYAFPSPDDPAKLAGVAERAQRMYAETNLALVANFSGALLARGQLLRGQAQFLGDLLGEPELAEALLDRILDYNIALVERFLGAISEFIQVIKFSDDLGAQDNLLISPALYRRMIKPRQARFLQAIRRHTSARILYHTCGSVHKLIDDFVEVGVDILNPIQVSARGMDTAMLANKYGARIAYGARVAYQARLAFWGALDVQGVISQGTPEATMAQVRQRIADLAGTGGYVLAGSHNLPPETPAANVLALCRAGREVGE